MREPGEAACEAPIDARTRCRRQGRAFALLALDEGRVALRGLQEDVERVEERRLGVNAAQDGDEVLVIVQDATTLDDPTAIRNAQVEVLRGPLDELVARCKLVKELRA